MCGLVGYIGRQTSRNSVLKGLKRLEYRGYDSAGFACLTSQKQLLTCRSVGALDALVHRLEQEPIDGPIGIGHTRWSTHGIVTEENAHPQSDCFGHISVAHNGIIENSHELKQKLLSNGHHFRSSTDTEVIAHLLEQILAQPVSLEEALCQLVSQLEGAYAVALLVKQYPHHLIAIRKKSPLCLGIAQQEVFVASDPAAFCDSTQRVIFLPDESFTLLAHDGTFVVSDFQGNKVSVSEKVIDATSYDAQKTGYEHFMLKEIYEQKGAIQETYKKFKAGQASLWQELGITPEQIGQISNVVLIGCGTSWHAGCIGRFFLETIAGIPATAVLASEFRYMSFFPSPTTLYILISQSGETADTLEALRLLNMHQLMTVALSNNALSTLVREAKGSLVTAAGAEIAVVSTKTFVTQVIALYWLAYNLASARSQAGSALLADLEADIYQATEALEQSIVCSQEYIKTVLAPFYASFAHMVFLGRNLSFVCAQEAALKLKEISYIFIETYPAGELKHGPLALLDEKTPVVLFSTLDPLIYPKLVANAQEVKARKAHLLVYAFEGQDELMQLADQVCLLPTVKPLLVPLVMAGVTQLLAYYVAKYLERPIDKPRNLAKSVTVE